MAELTRFAGAFPRAIPALACPGELAGVAGIQREAGGGWLDAGDEPRHDKGGRAWRN